jgi:type I restriction enzyme, R subunit
LNNFYLLSRVNSDSDRLNGFDHSVSWDRRGKRRSQNDYTVYNITEIVTKMSEKEATARIKINKLLEAAGWLFFAEGDKPANIRLEPTVQIKSTDLDEFGEDFEKNSKGFIDFLLLNEKGFPFIVLEAKAKDKHPLIGKEQARQYAESQKCRFVILSNGDVHYFWDLQRGNPEIITAFPTPKLLHI